MYHVKPAERVIAGTTSVPSPTGRGFYHKVRGFVPSRDPQCPSQHSTGGQTRLWGSRKRGESSRRTLLIHGARATRRWARTQTDRRSQGIRGLLERRGWHRTAVAVAHKHGRIVWALRHRGGGEGGTLRGCSISPYDARCHGVEDTRSQTGCLKPCFATRPVRPRCC